MINKRGPMLIFKSTIAFILTAKALNNDAEREN